MPEIDVTDILRDSFVAATRFPIIRRREVVNDHGEMTVVPTRLWGIGSITPTGDNSLVRQDAYQTQANTIKVITQTRLYGQQRTPTAKYQPDLIVWNGNYYLVKSTNDYTPFGRGFIEADCSSIEFNDLPSFLFEGAQFMFSAATNSGLIPLVGCKCC